ncbi:MAG: Trk system potassium transporter TrkA, partial [Clostridia bacterium]|nr:Trk system potassium transporter TrkA [Clostridia bacterium]
AVSVHRIAKGRVEALEFVVNKNSRYIGEPLKNLHLKKNVLMACITRQGKTVIPDGNSTFTIGDTVIIVTSREEPIMQFNGIFA